MLLRSSLLSSVVSGPLRSSGDEGAADPPDPKAAADQESDDSNDPGAKKDDPPADPDPGLTAKKGDEGAADPPDPPDPKTPARDWRDREINRKHAQVQEGKRREEELRRENEELRSIAARAAATPKKGDEADPAPTPRADARQPLDRDAVREEAQRLNAQTEYTRDCNAANAAGKKAYPKWDEAVDRLVTLGGVDIDTMVYILATDDPAKVMYELGSNPDEYHRVMELPFAKRNTELVKLALKGKDAAPKPKKVSEAPAPVEGVQGRGTRAGDGLDDDLDDETWFARRRTQKTERWKADRAAGRV